MHRQLFKSLREDNIIGSDEESQCVPCKNLQLEMIAACENHALKLNEPPMPRGISNNFILLRTNR